MRPALIIYCFFLTVESGLAWAVTGNAFLGAATLCGMLFYAAVWRLGGPWGEMVRALSAGLISVAGPLYYQAEILPTILCFITLPHLLAATQCFWEIALGRDPAQHNMRMRTVVFTVAFYAAMGLVFILLRGDPRLSPWITGSLAVAVLLAALPAWDLARVARLKPARSRRPSPFGVIARRLMLLGAVLGAVAVVFFGMLPPAAEKLCEISPRWQAKVETPDQAPPRPPPPPPSQNDGAVTRPGMDTSAMTGRHELPDESDIQSSGEVRLRLKPAEPAAAERLARDIVYVRSHSLDSWNDGVWTTSSGGGRWLSDESDGSADGLITVKPSPAGTVRHTIYLDNADGYSLPALQGVCAYALPAVYAVPGDLFQMQAAGNIRYEAVSAPLVWDQLPSPAQLKAGSTGIVAHTSVGVMPALTDLFYGNALLRPDNKANLAAQIEGMRKWFAENIRYSTVMKGDDSLTAMDNFLFRERRGYCDFYASAACLMLRLAKVPARVAYGYAGRSFDPKSGLFTFTDDTAHAWTEIHVEGYGWTICDFTPAENTGSLNGAPDPAADPFSEEAYEAIQQKKPEPPPEQQPEEFSLTKWWNDTVTRLLAMKPMELTTEILKWLTAAAVAVLLLRWAAKRRKPAGEGGADAFAGDERQPAYFAEFLRTFTGLGMPRPAGSTPREYYGQLVARGLAGPEFAPMIDYHYQSRYADAARDRDQEAAWVALARETAERLRQRMTGT